MSKFFKLSKKILLGLIVIAVCLFTFIASPTDTLKNNTNKVILNADTWNSKLAEIEKVESNVLTKYISIKTLVTLDNEELVKSVSNPSTIDANTVIMLNDGLDVYYFSEICNPILANGTQNNYYKTYLSLNYTLGADIDYEDASKTFKMLRPIGWNEPFSGTFDGRGYTISNIFFRPFEDITEIQDNYPNIVYISWFSQNSGTIKNLGILDANMIQYNVYEPSIFASPFVGANLSSGKIENCFVQDLRKAESGLSVEGGYDVAMFVCDNLGLIKNCYVACDRITSSSITITNASTRHPFCNGNKGTLIDCFYDIDTLTSQGQTYTDGGYAGLTGLKTAEFLTDKFNYKNDNGEFEGIWYSNYTYPVTHASYLKLNYPILKGFELTNVDNHEYFVISDIVDFIYLSELIEIYQPFRSSSYLLTNSIDLNSTKPGSYVFSSAVFSGTLKSGYKTVDGYTTTYSKNVIYNNDYPITLADGSISNFNSIINLNIDTGNSYNGYNCYGLFGVLAGSVENINIVNTTISLSGIKQLNEHEVNTIGTVCGLLEDGNISNVNIYSDIYLSKDKSATSTFLGKMQVGGICGTATDGTISSCTTNGTINKITYTSVGSEAHEHSIGGILGKALNNDGVINCLNNIDINGINYQSNLNITNYRQYVGGVIGSGEINNASELQNNGKIYIGTTKVTNTKYSQTYVAGVIGRVENATGTNGLYLNNSNIYYYVNDNNYKAYISGVMNVISTTADKYDTLNNITLNATNVQEELNNQKPFEFTSVTNAGILNIENELTASKSSAKYSVFDTTITNGIDIRSAGISYSYLTNMNVLGGYNLNYHYERVNKELITVDNTAQNIDISMIEKYGPAFNADNKIYYVGNKLHLSTVLINPKINNQALKVLSPVLQVTINLKRVYNYNDVNYITKKTVNMFNLLLSGCINGRNFNLENIRNDGNVNVYFTHATNSVKFGNSTYKNYFGDQDKVLKVYGVFEEVSLDHRARDIYNGGNVTVSCDAANNIVPNFTLHASGICYKNVGNDKQLASNAATEDILIERGYIGSLHNCINNGEIRLTRGDITNTNTKITEPGRFYGGVRLAGITAINASTISQTFNLGDVYNINEVFTESTGTYGDFSESTTFEVETGGFCFVMQNEVYNIVNNVEQLTSANIIDSANNGTIVSMNTSTSQSFTNAGGFVARNDRGEEGALIAENDGSTNSVSRQSHRIKIQYSINYGDIYAYNSYTNVMYNSEQQSKAAGFVCLGACTVVDVINYGNIYGNSVASGIFGYLYISRMTDGGMGTNSPIYIANSINYGKAQVMAASNNNVTKLRNIGSTNETVETRTITNDTGSTNTRLYVAGALIGVWGNGEGASDLTSMQVKYLINFAENLNILGCTQGQEYTDASYSDEKEAMLRNMANANTTDSSPSPFNTDKTNYAYGIRCYSKDTAEPNSSITDIYSQERNGGIFNEDYSLRRPIVLTYDQNGNVDARNTDNFIADYIQFVPYSKVNDYLVRKIGLDTAVLVEALEKIIKDSSAIQFLLDASYNENESNSIYNTLLNQYASKLETEKQNIIDALSDVLRSDEYTVDELKEILEVLMTDTQTLEAILSKQNIIKILQSIVDEISDEKVLTLFNKMLNDEDMLYSVVSEYPELFKDYISEYAIDENNTSLIVDLFEVLVDNDNVLQSYINSLSEDERSALSLELYNLLRANSTIQNAIVKVYPDIEITSNNQLTQLENYVIGNNNSITLTEYQNIFNSMVNYTFDIPSVINAISNKNNMITFLDKITSNSNTSAINMFLESGRTNSQDIYLPATKGNHLAVVSASNYIYQTTIPSTDITNNSYIYTGTHYLNNNNFTEGGARNYELYIVSNNNTYYRTRSGNNRYYYYWTLSNNTFTFNRQTSTQSTSYFNITYYGKSLNNYQSSSNNKVTDVHTGVFASASNSNTDSSNVSELNYNNVTYSSFIDYTNNNYQKNNSNLNYYMILAMKAALNNNSLTLNQIKNYLITIYNNSTVNRDAFIEILCADQISSLKNQYNTMAKYKQFIDENISLNNYQVVLNNITNTTAQKALVELLSTDYSLLLMDLLKVLSQTNQNEKIKELVDDIFAKGATQLTKNEIQSILTYIRTIITTTVLTNNDKREFVSNLSPIYYEELLNYAFDNNLLTTDQLVGIIYTMLKENINLLTSKKDSLSNKIGSDFKNAVSSNLIVDDENLFNQYIKYDSLSDLLKRLEEGGIDSSVYTDSTGIYALASSLGIEAGLFLPDNIELIGMDYYYTTENGEVLNDPTWRGGTSDEPNSYNKNDTDKVNYKVYYEMKQLKKSIATIIFEMELTDGVNIVTNDVDTDYYCGYKEVQNDGSYITRNEVYYYIPYNHDILLSDYIYVNTATGSYELSYGATFDDANELRVSIPNIDTLKVGDTLMDTFIVQAEDTTVKTTYTVIITITESSYLNFDVDQSNNTRFNITFNGTATNVTSTSKEIYTGVNVVTDVTATSKVAGYNGVIRVTLSTFNMMNKLNMVKNIKVYQADNESSDKEYDSKTFKKLTLNTDYVLNDVQNNGIVVIAGESGTGYNPATNAYNPGTVFYDLSLSNNLPMGTYLIEVVLNSEYSYYLLFDKAASTYAMLESITYNNQEFDNDNSTSNQNAVSYHPYGTTISRDDLIGGKYVDSVVVSPLSTYEITDATVQQDTSGIKQYLITYVVTAEDKTTKFTFTHYIKEEDYSRYINNIYYNGGIIAEGPIEKDQNEDYIFEDSFEKTATPSYRFDYRLDEFYVEADSNFFKVIAYDYNGKVIDDEVLAEYMNIYVTEGKGFEISFLHDALSEVYYFELVYQNTYQFSGTNTLTWNVVFDRIMLQKLKSRNSYLDNATFLSESVVSSIRTMIDVNAITLEEYSEMLVSPTRKIVCLPGQIHYNEYSYSYDESTGNVTKQDDFYVIGLVNKTQLEWYSPTFTLPEGAKIYRTTTIDGVVYRYVPYYTDKLNDLTAFLVSEDGTLFRDEETKEIISITGDENSFVYNGKTYTLSPVTGLQSTEYNGVTIINTTLYTNYIEEGSFKEGPNGEIDGYFDYVHYRVYAEIYGDESVNDKPASDYYTDYFIATQDLTNNIRFNIIIDKAAGCDINTKVYNVYAEFVCYQLVGSVENDKYRDGNYELYNRAGLFGYFKNESVSDVVVAEHISLQSNTFGWYSIYLALPDGYTFTYRFEDKGASKIYTEGQECYVESSITARTITIHITIQNDNIYSNDDWGVKVENESFIKPITKEEE